MKGKRNDTVRLNFEFPKEEYPYLKMVSAKRGMSLENFARTVLLKAIEEFEDEMLDERANKRLESIGEEDLISWEEVKRLLDWDDEKA